MKDYKEVWNNLSDSFASAAFYVCCIEDEDEIRRNGELTAEFLKQVLQITSEDRVLEIGCGVARIGKELAPSCGEWHGADISGNMIEYAAQRTEGMPNVYLHELPDSSLGIFPDNYFDCVYSSIVFMHLDKLDMFRYIREAFRVLAPGGRAYFDTYNILSPEAWQQFLTLYETYPPGVRPGHMSQFSSPQELEKFMVEAGFDSVHIDGSNPQLVVALGTKPAQPGFERATLSPDLDPTRNAYRRGTASDDAPSATGGDETPARYFVARSRKTVVADDSSNQESYLQKLQRTLDEKNQYIEDLEERLQEYHRAMLKERRLRGVGAAVGLALAARSMLGRRNR